MDPAITTQRERDRFLALLDEWIANHLPTAPREQLESVEAVLHRWRPSPNRLHREFTD